MAAAMDNRIDIEDRMRRFVKCDGSLQSVSNVLCNGLNDREQEALALGIRAGKHSAAVTVMRELQSEVGDVVAQKIDPYIRLEKSQIIKACKKQVARDGVFWCTEGKPCKQPGECPNFRPRSVSVVWPKTL